MKRTGIILLLLLWITSWAWAQNPSFEALFQAGLKASQTKAYEEAQKQFQEALKLEPRNVAAMTNLGLSFAHQDQNGFAIAWFRRALAIDPGFQPARQALEYSVSKLEIKEIPHRIETSETLRTYFLQYISLPQFLFLTLALMFLSGWKLLAWLGQRRRAKRSDSDEAPLPFPVSTAILLLLFVMSAGASALKAHELSSPRGTIVALKVDALSVPGEDGVALFELHQGFEVLVGEMQDEWIQVTYPGASTGWIPKKDLIPVGEGF